MNKHLITLLLLLTTQIVKSQKVKFSFDKPDLQKVESIESNNEGKLIPSNNRVTFSVSKNYFPNSDSFNLAQPLSSVRETKPLRTLVKYFYSVPDSIVRLIEYTWNSTNDGIPDLNKIFEYNSTQFSKLLGNEGKTEVENHENWTQKTTIWENEIIHIKQFMVTGSNTYRVRVLMSWK